MRRRLGYLVLAMLALLAADAVARAEYAMVLFKDGFVQFGDVRKQGSVQVDPYTGESVWMPAGSFLLDTGPRRVFFSHLRVQAALNQAQAQSEDLKIQNKVSRSAALHIYPLTHILSCTNWDERWERTFRIQAPFGKLDIKQRLSILTPEYARVDAIKYAWNPFYLTQEFGADTVHKLLASAPDLKLKKDDKDASRRFKIYRFLAQAGFLDEAGMELDSIAATYAEEKQKVDEARADLQKLRTLRLYEEVERAHQAGRSKWVREQLGKFPREGLDDKLLARIRSLKTAAAASEDNLAEARRLLKPLSDDLSESTRPFFAEAVDAILAELGPENIDRLDEFLKSARDAERDRKQGRKPQNEPDQLLALAVTGWLLGKESAENKVETARRLWRARQFALEYQHTDDEHARELLLRGYQKQAPAGLDELTQVIVSLPPPRAEKEIPTNAVEFDVGRSITRRKAIKYLVQLPPEYRHTRSYPVLFLLHDSFDPPKAFLERVAKQAGEHGYITVAPEWIQNDDKAYHYTPDEHAAVLDVLRDLRQRFQVDSDRVFVFGVGQGGNMAYDVGLAHPDQFAGILVMDAVPQKFPARCWHNAQLLPLYIVDGDLNGDHQERLRTMLQRWVPKGYPVLDIEYKGRGYEWFAQEIPTMLDWMDHKRDLHKRATAVPELGRNGGDEFQTFRPGDDRFYWLSTDAISERNIIEPGKWSNQTAPASLCARIHEGNQVNVFAHGVRRVSVWLAKDMIDFTKPVTVRINGIVRTLNTRVQPSLTTLMEDLHARGDRQRLFWARLDYDRP
jgi:pimeloyl-ACP methyl ester carboxylesterase